MASSILVHSLCCTYTPKCYKAQTLTLTGSQFLSSGFFLKKKQSQLLSLQFNKTRTGNSRSIPVVAAQSNFLKVIQTVWKVGRDGIEAGTNLVPESVPRPVARISVTIVALTIALFVLKSFLSTAFFVLATMGLAYFIYIALNKDQGPTGSGGTKSSEDPLEEARRIMEKYK